MSLKHLLLALLVAFLWGFNFVALKAGLDSFPPIFFTVVRFFFVSFPAVLFLKRGAVPWKIIIPIGLVFGVLQYGFIMIGMDLGMPGGLTSIALQAQAVFTLVLSSFILRDPPVFAEKLGVGIAVVGLAIIAANMGMSTTLLGLAFVLASALSWAYGNILLKRAGETDMLRLTAWMGLVPPVPMLLLSLVMEDGQWHALTHTGLVGWATVAYSGMISTLVAFAMWANLVRRYSANTVAPFSLLVPVFGLVGCGIVLGESLSVTKIVGCLVIFVGLAVIVVGKRRHEALRRAVQPNQL